MFSAGRFRRFISKAVLFVTFSLYLGCLTPMVAQVSSAWGDLKPGPYAVGFQTTRKYDYSRADETKSERQPSRQVERARPMQIWIWYPAKKENTRANMLYEDYVQLTTDEERDSASTSAEKISSARSLMMNPVFADLQPNKINDLLEMKTAAIKDARPREGRFPLIVFGQGYFFESPMTHSVLYEYLGSHGYVVASVPYEGYPLRSSFHDLVGLEQEVRDMEFVIAYMHDFPNVDHDKLAAVGFDYGGMAALLLQMRNTNVEAVVGIDTGIMFRHNNVLLKQSPYYGLASVRVPLMLITRTHVENGDDEDLSIYDQAKYSNRFLLRLKGMGHEDFTSYGMMRAILRANNPDQTSKRSGYEVTCRYVLNFLDGYVKGDRQALTYLNQKPEASESQEQFVTIERKEALKAPPRERDFVELLLAEGIKRAREIYRDTKSSDPTYVLFKENTLNTLGYQFLQIKKFTEAIDIFELNAEAYPQSWNVYDSLGEAYMRNGEKKFAIQNYKKSLELNPQNSNAAEMIKRLAPE